MDRFKRILRKIFFILPIPTLIAAVFGFGFVIAVAAFKIEIPALQYLSYISSAYALIVTITGFPYLKALVKKTKQRVINSTPMKWFRGTSFGERYFGDIRFRTEISLYVSLFINFLYIAIKLFSGIYYRSVWFISLAVYYILLAVMRFILLHKGKRSAVFNMETALKRYRLCGIMLLVMNLARYRVAHYWNRHEYVHGMGERYVYTRNSSWDHWNDRHYPCVSAVFRYHEKAA